MQFPNEPQTEEDIRYPEWQEPFRKALLELDDDKLSARITAAETAIHNRLRALAGDSLVILTMPPSDCRPQRD
jgi:hypothetical protein